MRTIRTALAVLALGATTSVPAMSQTQYDQWAGWDSGRADRLAAQSVRHDGRPVQTIQAQPLRGSVNEVLHQRAQQARVVQTQPNVVVSHYPAHQVVTTAPRSNVAVNVGYQRYTSNSSVAVGVSAASGRTAQHYSQTYYAHPGTTVVHQRVVHQPILPPIYLYPAPCPPQRVVVRPICPPPVIVHRQVYRPVYRAYSYCPPPSGLSISFSYRR
jgi:hypothetical protein